MNHDKFSVHVNIQIYSYIYFVNWKIYLSEQGASVV